MKALVFIRDKTTSDKFNGRVITRNGKITAEEARTIAEAAELYGSGEVTMTSRLTVEIQGVPYDNIEPLREYLMQAGLETGGDGIEGPSGCILQRHNMPVWIDRYIWAFRGDTRTLLSRVFQREIAGQV
ncbi:hypothetical protein [Faecalicatena contorta]|uniref:hypothetical protein n=1 Tax=Clostridia TaxID=186801 RepID=UPI002FE6DBD0